VTTYAYNIILCFKNFTNGKILQQQSKLLLCLLHIRLLHKTEANLLILGLSTRLMSHPVSFLGIEILDGLQFTINIFSNMKNAKEACVQSTNSRIIICG
jgi:hypothetical protein